MNIGFNVFGQPVHEDSNGFRKAISDEPGLLLIGADPHSIWLCCCAAILYPKQHLSNGLGAFLSKIRLPPSSKDMVSAYLVSAFFRFAPLFKGSAATRMMEIQKAIPEAPFTSALFAASLGYLLKDSAGSISFSQFPFIPPECSLLTGVKFNVSSPFSLPQDCVPPLPPNKIGLPDIKIVTKYSREYLYLARGNENLSDGFIPLPLTPGFGVGIPEGSPYDFGDPPNTLTDLFSFSAIKHQYDPISSLPASASMSPALAEAFGYAKSAISPEDLLKWDEDAAKSIGVDIEVLPKLLSAEQIDANVMARKAIRAKKGFIVADETGLGKGRSLASVALSFLSEGGRVLFITEKKALFSDFWRDLSNVSNGKPLPEPLIIHPHGKIFTSGGEILYRHPPPKKMKLIEAATSDEMPNLAFSCYSQYNRPAKGNKKIEFALKYLSHGPCLVILDEAHNAAGDSTTRTNIDTLIAGRSVIYSSATFAKTGKALSLYSKALPMTNREIALLEDCFFKEPPTAFGEAVSCSLTSSGYLLRREHAFESVPVSEVLNPPKVREEELLDASNSFTEAIVSMFALAESVQKWRMDQFGERESVWMKMGGVLSRLSRQNLLLSKITDAVSFAVENHKNGRKTVFALESTFESFLKDIQDKSFSSDSDDLIEIDVKESVAPMWPELVKAVALKCLPEGSDTDPSISVALLKVNSACSKLPNWPASPIDHLRHLLSVNGITSSEISGRQTRIRFDNEQWIVEPRPACSREMEALAFNSGDSECIIVTRAGSTGISLHASPDFIDQRPRDMLELEVALNPGERVQFFGRVRRKGQIHEPRFFTLSNGSLYERRHLEAQNKKLLRLSSLTNGKSIEGIFIGDPWTGRIGNRVCLEWLGANPDMAKLLGVSAWEDPSSFDETADKVLRRINLLSRSQQDEIADLLQRAVICGATWDEESSLSDFSEVVFLRRRFSCGVDMPSRGDFSPSLWFSDYICLPQAFKSSATFEPEHSLQNRSILNSAFSSFNESIRHPARQADVVALNTLAKMSPGDGFHMQSPEGGLSSYICLGVRAPDDLSLVLNPSQWTVWFKPLEDDVTRQANGAQIARAASFGIVGFIPENRRKQPQRLHKTFLEGHSALSEWWRQTCNKGAWTKVFPFFGRPRPTVLLPYYPAGASDWEKTPFPLFEPEQVISHLQTYPNDTLYDNTDSKKASMSLYSISGGYYLALSPKAVKAGMPPFSVDRNLDGGKPVKVGDEWWSTKFVPPSMLKFLVSQLRANGVSFFAPSSLKLWHSAKLKNLLSR